MESSTTPTRSGISNHVPSITGSSPQSTHLVRALVRQFGRSQSLMGNQTHRSLSSSLSLVGIRARLDGGLLFLVIWWPLGKHDKLISIDDRNIFLWNVDMSNKSAKVISQGSADMLPNLSGGAWDPHNHNSIASISDSSLHLWDLRSMEKSSAIEHAHIRDVDYNPKKQHIIATTEDDFGICLWDLRMLKLPLKDLPGHSHWTWAIQHNPEYDELLLSAGTDSTVNLWLAKVSNNDSEPNSPSGSPNRQEEPLLNSYTDYEDSIYGIAWSSHDPSLFASLSYDGRVVLESVKPYLQRK
ncbi:protein TSSC1 isoform X3 [Zea mays]|uniref:EIPR1-like beta-propeller domain-containing protein n=1 Tax=Zea mays TaxID=4577 RepID=A0A804NRG6_MAIZE|nr:protein TSSC1 isoform X3 [Zea mays]XP_008677311.1 protein TSSC1 isoform X3 [Zea mays]|eukprot:XP_008677310.1 protein TSSC1 isoform X3 [Zea mays]